MTKKVCRSTIQAGTYQLQLGVGKGDLLNPAIADAKNQLDRNKWEASATATYTMVWFTDCDLAVKTLDKFAISKITDKQLLQGNKQSDRHTLRQNLWRLSGQDRGDLYDENVYWNTTQLVEAVTKKGLKQTQSTCRTLKRRNP